MERRKKAPKGVSPASLKEGGGGGGGEKIFEEGEARNNFVVDVVVGVLLVGLMWWIGSHLERMEEMGMPLLLWLQGIRSTPMDAIVRIFSALGMEIFFLLIPFSLFWLRNPQHHPHHQQHTKSAWKQQWPLGNIIFFFLHSVLFVSINFFLLLFVFSFPF